jgi:hypothetical protein
VEEKQVMWLLTGAVLLRCLWLPAFPQLSDDYARFVWDGRLLANGYNPFFYLPETIMQNHYPPTSVDPGLYNVLNSQEYYTCYPPLLQVIFGISARIFPHSLTGNLIVLRLFSFIAELGSLVLFWKILQYFKKSTKTILLYAFNPLVIAELMGNFHYEGVVIFFLLAAYYYLLKQKNNTSALLFAGAVLTKLVPLIFLPVILSYLGLKIGLQYCLIVGALFVLAWMPFLDSSVIQKFWSSIDSFFVESEYNAGIYYIVRWVVAYFTHENMIQLNGPILTILSGVLILFYSFSKFKKIDLPTLPLHFSYILLIYLAFTTTVHPWYITPMIAMSVFSGLVFPIAWSAVIFLSYYPYHTEPLVESTLLLFAEYIVVMVAVFYDSKKSFLMKGVD